MISIQTVRENIYQIVRDGRAIQVVLDKDLAGYYGIAVKRLTELVVRTGNRGSLIFDGECFELTKEEWFQIIELRSQSATSGNTKEVQILKRGHLPKGYTAKGAIAVSKIINNKTADDVYISTEHKGRYARDINSTF
jgi:hypothetical protein